jgi:transcriptional regulator with XRE-family HTH domain
LGSELRRLRDAAELDQAAAAKHLDCSTSKISRIEKGMGVPKVIELRALLDLYNVTDMTAREQIEEIRRRAGDTGWWEQPEYEEVLPSGLGVYVGLEYDARSVQVWSLGYVPGLLQTRDYATAVIGDRGSHDAARVERLVEVRMQRQARLRAENSPLELWAVMDESVLLRPVGGPDVMRAQIRALQEAAELPNVTIQIHPLSKAPHPGLRGSFILMEFGPSDPRVGHAEGQGGNLFIEKDPQVRAMARELDRLRAGALDPPETAARLAELAAKEPQQ